MRFGVILDEDLAQSPEVFARMVRYFYEGIAFANQEYIETHPTFPRLYDSGVRYKYAGTFDFIDAPTVYRRQWGSCGHLAAWRVAELRAQGYQASIAGHYQGEMDGLQTYHILVYVDSLGEYEDPSTILGMGT